MKLIPRDAPHIHHNDSARTVMGDVILAMLPLYFIAFCFYGLRAPLLGLTSALTCYLSDMLCTKLRGSRVNLYDFSALVTGLLIPLMLPATIGYLAVITAGLFAIVVVKHPFGGVGQNIFNPAAAGLAFVTACWPDQVFRYPQLFEKLPVLGDAAVGTVNSTAYILKMGGVPSLDQSEMFLGILPGPMGATNILVIIACLIFLSYRKTICLSQVGAFTLGVAAISMLMPRVAVGPFDSFFMEIMSGSLLFGAVFMVTDPATIPKRWEGRVLYGLLAGIAAMLIRFYGGFEQSIVYTILLLNIVTPVFDWVFERYFVKKERRVEHALPKAAASQKNS